MTATPKDLSQYVATAICLMKAFPDTIGEMPHAEVLDRCADALLTTETVPFRWSGNRRDFLKSVIAERAEIIIRHEWRIGIGSNSENSKRLCAHLLEMVGLEPHKSIFYIDDMEKLYAIEAELRRLHAAMKIDIKPSRYEDDDEEDGDVIQLDDAREDLKRLRF